MLGVWRRPGQSRGDVDYGTDIVTPKSGLTRRERGTQRTFSCVLVTPNQGFERRDTRSGTAWVAAEKSGSVADLLVICNPVLGTWKIIPTGSIKFGCLAKPAGIKAAIS